MKSVSNFSRIGISFALLFCITLQSIAQKSQDAILQEIILSGDQFYVSWETDKKTKIRELFVVYEKRHQFYMGVSKIQNTMYQLPNAIEALEEPNRINFNPINNPTALNIEVYGLAGSLVMDPNKSFYFKDINGKKLTEYFNIEEIELSTYLSYSKIWPARQLFVSQSLSKIGLNATTRRRFIDAQNVYEKLVLTNPTFHQYYLSLSHSYYMLKNVNPESLAKSLSVLNDGLEKCYSKTELYTRRAEIYLAENRFSEAIKDLDVLYKTDPQSKIILNRIKAYFYAGEYKTCLKAVKEAEGKYMTNADKSNAYVFASMCYDKMGKDEESIQELKKAVDNDPNDLQTQVTYGLLLAKKGKYNEAVEIYEILKSQNPRNGLVLYSYAEVHFYGKNAQAGCLMYRTAMRSGTKSNKTQHELYLQNCR